MEREYNKRIDTREPKVILDTEMYLTIPMVRRLLNCTYDYARRIIKKGREIEKERDFLVIEEKILKMKTSTFKEIVKGGIKI